MKSVDGSPFNVFNKNQMLDGYGLEKRDILNVPKAIKRENENEGFDIEGDVIKTEMKVERGNDLESETEGNKRISAEHEILNVHKTVKRVEIKSENEKQHKKKQKNQISFSVREITGDLEKKGGHVSIQKRKSFKKMNWLRGVTKLFNVTFV